MTLNGPLLGSSTKRSKPTDKWACSNAISRTPSASTQWQYSTILTRSHLASLTLSALSSSWRKSTWSLPTTCWKPCKEGLTPMEREGLAIRSSLSVLRHIFRLFPRLFSERGHQQKGEDHDRYPEAGRQILITGMRTISPRRLRRKGRETLSFGMMITSSRLRKNASGSKSGTTVI